MSKQWKIALLDVHTEKVKKMISSLVPSGFTLVMAESGDVDERQFLVKDADFLITAVPKISEGFMRSIPNLRLIHKWGIGVDTIDLESARKLGIGVAITTGSNAIPVAELAVTLMQSVYRNIPFVDRNIRKGEWLKLYSGMRECSHMLYGKKVGLIGFGFIGKAVARLLQGFSVEIIYFDTHHATPEEEKELGAHFVQLDELISSADIISLHLPLNQHTKHLIQKEHLQKMKPSAIIVNSSRGGIIKENDLIWALENKLICGAGLDVLEKEPPDKNNPLFKMNNVVLTCHMGGVVVDNVYNMARHIFTNIEKVARGEELLAQDIVVPPKKQKNK